MAGYDTAAGIVLGQVTVGEKTNETLLFTSVCDRTADARGSLVEVLVTADGLHTQTGHTHDLHARSAHLLATVKANQPTLYARLKSLPWNQVPAGHTSYDRGHGRIETRMVKALTAAGLGFLHAAQAVRIHRSRAPLNRCGKRTRKTAYALCTLPAEHAQPAELADWARAHWRIENQLHWCPTSLSEDSHQAHTGNGPAVMATLRNTAIGLIRSAGETNIARATRHYAHRPTAAITLATSGNTNTQ